MANPQDTRRRLILMRHAKSDWNSGAGPDHARPLNARGRRDAPRVAQALLALGWAPVHVHTSDAQRTLETWSLMAAELPEVSIQPTRQLYHGDLDALCREAPAWPEGTVLALGHNPGWEEAVSELTGIPTSLTTANAALLEGTGATWAAALQGTWRLVDVLRPKSLQ